MHNLSTVLRFEVLRTIKKKTFWIMALLFPLMMGAIFAILFFSNKASEDASKTLQKEQFSILLTDHTGLISPAVESAVKAKTVSDKAVGIRAVKRGKVDAYFYYPKDLTTSQIEVYAKDVGLFDNDKYSSVARALLSQSVAQTVTPNTRAILSGTAGVQSTTYKDGEQYNGFMQMIAPGMFLVLFYALIALFGNQMLNSTTEEKENRVIEMILTTIEARTLIIGKILSLLILGLLQVIIIIVPIVIAYFLLRDSLSLPNISLADIPLDPVRIVVGFLIFFVSFLLFTCLLVAIGSAVPTAKEASGFMGVVMILIFGPLYAASLYVSAPESTIVQVLSYVPFVSTLPLLIRNAVGNLPLLDAAISIVILIITTWVVLRIAIRAFSYGALEYSRRLKLSELFQRH